MASPFPRPIHLPRLPAVLAGLLLAAAPAAPRAAPVPVASFEDAEGDASDPAAATPPAGVLDLRRFAVLADGEEVLLVVTLGAALPPEGLGAVTVDVYLDTDNPAPGAGTAAALPGRGVAFADGRTWEAAVVLTSQPAAARAAVAALGPAAERVVVPEPLTLRGRTVTARLPAAALGGPPRPGWGYAVVVAGAPPGAPHAQVADVLLPPGADQARLLAGLDPASGRLAPIPFLSPLPSGSAAPAAAAAAPAPEAPPASPPPPAAMTLAPNLMPRLGLAPGAHSAPARGEGPVVVTAITDDLVTAKGPVEGLQPMQFGRVVNDQGVAVARVMILRLVDQGLLASAIAGKERIRPGLVMLFDPPAAAPGAKP